jgi:hypothetical protein
MAESSRSEDPPAAAPPLPRTRLGDLVVHAGEAHRHFLAQRVRSAGDLLRLSGEVVDRNTDKCVLRLAGPSGTLYLKRFVEGRPTHVLKRLFAQRLKSLARLEVENILRLRRWGIGTAEVLFWGHTSRWGIDGALSFVGLGELLGCRSLEADAPAEAVEAAARVLVAMAERGFFWPDAKPKHFFWSARRREIAVIDLHGGEARRSLAPARIAKMVRRFLAFSGRDRAFLESVRAALSEAAGTIGDGGLRHRFLEAVGGTR